VAVGTVAFGVGCTVYVGYGENVLYALRVGEVTRVTTTISRRISDVGETKRGDENSFPLLHDIGI
jgi:hypothetical protein